MKFIVDAQLPLKLAVALTAAGHDAVHTLNLPDKNRSSDTFITRLADSEGRAAPLVVPDPRWMALHKLWLADKPERRADKKEKDRRQGTVLLDAARYFLQASHPLNIDFVLELPEELRLYFDQWCLDAGFIPQP